jgi:polyphosphate kinase
MDRNLFRRVETAWRVLTDEHKRRVLDEGLAMYLRDNQQSWTMGANAEYTKIAVDGQPVSAQNDLLNRLCGP